MKTQELISDLRNALNDVKKGGNTTIPISGLEAYLANVESIVKNQVQTDQESVNRELAWKKLETDIKVWEVQTNTKSMQDVEMFKSVVEAGAAALKAAIVINGGAAAALMAFLGELIAREAANKTCVYPISSLGYALLIFIFGMGFAGVSSGLRYIAQFVYHSSWRKTGHGFNFASIGLGALSFAAFFYGGVSAYLTLIQ